MPDWIIFGAQVGTIIIAYFWGRSGGIESMEKKLLKAEVKQREVENALQKKLSETAQHADHVINSSDIVGELHKHGEIRPNE